MADNTFIVGVLGTAFTWTFANSFFGTISGILTCVWLIWKLYRMWKDKE